MSAPASDAAAGAAAGDGLDMPAVERGAAGAAAVAGGQSRFLSALERAAQDARDARDIAARASELALPVDDPRRQLANAKVELANAEVKVANTEVKVANAEVKVANAKVELAQDLPGAADALQRALRTLHKAEYEQLNAEERRDRLQAVVDGEYCFHIPFFSPVCRHRFLLFQFDEG